MKISILVVIATYNRPNSFLEALKSIDNQDYENFSILISDNSTNAETERNMENVILKHKFKYVHRNPQLKGLDHFNLILKEVPTDYDYFMICHDDDTLREGAISSVSKLAEQYPSCVAIFSNGFSVKENGYVIGQCVKCDGNRVISSKKELADNFLNEKGLPFPAILYKKETSVLSFDAKKGGKYCDTAHAIDLLDFGPVLWATDNFILNYTISKSQDSNIIEPFQRRLLIDYLSKKCDFDSHTPLIYKFRVKDVYSYYVSNRKKFGKRKLFCYFGFLDNCLCFLDPC